MSYWRSLGCLIPTHFGSVLTKNDVQSSDDRKLPYGELVVVGLSHTCREPLARTSHLPLFTWDSLITVLDSNCFVSDIGRSLSMCCAT